MKANKVSIFVLVMASLAALGLPAIAGSEDCVQQCADQWFEDRQVCLDQLNTRLAQIDAETEACLDRCPPSNYLCQGNCVRIGNTKRQVANVEYRRCQNIVNTAAWSCLRDCQGSRFKP